MKIGFLPLYIQLYDDVGVTARARLEPFYESIAADFEAHGIEVLRSPFCRVKAEFATAVSRFEEAGADCIVTWHAAYSPSLESAEVLARTALPIVVLDTTETYEFSPEQAHTEIDYCHGIHGVMDMCNLLARGGKTYAIAAGHYPTSDVLEQAIGYVKAAAAAKSLCGSKVGTVGTSFDGMGDFLVSDETMAERFGVTVVHADGAELQALGADVSEADIAAEMARDLETCTVVEPFSEDCHRRTVREGLAVRRWLQNNDLGAFTVNFLDVGPHNGLTTMPFMEACKAMSRGIGYAGEGDVLTAAMTGALMRGFGDVSFVEIFCPDWKGERVFLSHMGEVNYALLTDKPELKELNFIYGKGAENPVIGYGCYREGPAVFVNVFVDRNGEYRLLAAPVTMEQPTDVDRFAGKAVRGWMKPAVPVAKFLKTISEAGVTHHSTLVYNATVDELAFFGNLLGMPVVCVE